jgi:hypothetical protein
MLEEKLIKFLFPFAFKFDGAVALRFSYVPFSKSHSLLRNIQTEYEVRLFTRDWKRIHAYLGLNCSTVENSHLLIRT